MDTFLQYPKQLLQLEVHAMEGLNRVMREAFKRKDI